ncbi:hypothetical protein NP233_g11224 [Leucocoprinus birnbaumii]|uniref:AAA+ ATPase domain-containing protein n=1 Tax=Leucocoprinus birnbaumii TaxID=56174 RepID=A0AAD5VIX5_9AGAR|nr:hypothetical protein NP233_g11224 [Leucocoprinus birnbaumii]
MSVNATTQGFRPTPGDIIIALVVLLVPQGRGKASAHVQFINLLTRGGRNARAAKSLEIGTQDIEPTRVLDNQGNEVVLLDIPGFNNSNQELSDKKIFHLVSDWLQRTYERDVKLSGLVYLHRIRNDRIADTISNENLHMFVKLCDAGISRVILVTTMWQKLTEVEQREGVGEDRERELKVNFWKTLVDQDSQVKRLKEGTYDEAWRIVTPLLDKCFEEGYSDAPTKVIPRTRVGRYFEGAREVVRRLKRSSSKMFDSVMRLESEPRYAPPPSFARFDFGNMIGVESVRVKEIAESDMVILIMGPTGAGKSTFIQTIAQLQGYEYNSDAGPQLTSGTKVVHAIRFHFNGGQNQNLVLVDTPGFDDTHRDDFQVLQIIVKWLQRTGGWNFFRANRPSMMRRINGILYLHRITDNRMAGSIIRSLKLFEKLCGENFYARVILTTTMWPDPDDPDELKDAEGREEELTNEYWKSMIERGTKVCRFTQDAKAMSAQDIINKIADSAGEIVNKVAELPGEIIHKADNPDDESLGPTMQLQEEVVGESKLAEDTAAGQYILEITTTCQDDISLNKCRRSPPFPVAKEDDNREMSAGPASQGITPEDIIIAFMGPTGSGKSFFIDLLTGCAGARAGKRLESVTQDLEAIRTQDNNGREVVLLDTPGFDDSKRTDKEILTLISNWLQKTYKNDVKLSGLIYLHRIRDNRMAGTPYKNLRMFGKLCGDVAMNRVMLVTTMWQKLRKAEQREGVGEDREKELKENFWKTLIDQGSQVERLKEATYDEAWRIVTLLIDKRLEENRPDAVLLQEELVDKGIALNETQAGQELQRIRTILA